VIGSIDLSGAYLNNMISVSSPPGSVTVTNSKFLGNGFSGLRIDTNGAVTLMNTTANVNRSVASQSFAGVQIDNTHDATASPVNITNGRFDGTISYGGNPTAGLAILSNGTVTLTGVQTQYNQGTGLTVDNTSGTGKVLLKGTNIFLGNTELGLDLLSTGQVTAEHLAAYHNGDYGVRIETQQAVAITGSGKFNGNRFGLKIDTNGPVIARNLSAISNLAIGMHVATSALADTEVVILSGINAYGNSGGLEIYADGKVIVSCGASYSNSVMGLYVDNHTYGTGGSAALTLRGFYSYLNGSWDEGLTTKTPVVRTACPTG